MSALSRVYGAVCAVFIFPNLFGFVLNYLLSSMARVLNKLWFRKIQGTLAAATTGPPRPA